MVVIYSEAEEQGERADEEEEINMIGKFKWGMSRVRAQELEGHSISGVFGTIVWS